MRRRRWENPEDQRALVLLLEILPRAERRATLDRAIAEFGPMMDHFMSHAEKLCQPAEPFVIQTLHAFIVTDEDGVEGIPAAKAPDGMAMPLVRADRARIESLRPIAQQIADGLGKKVVLTRFSVREDVDTLLPRSE